MGGTKQNVTWWTKMITTWGSILTAGAAIFGVMANWGDIMEFTSRVGGLWEASQHLEHLDETLHDLEKGVQAISDKAKEDLEAMELTVQAKLDSMEDLHIKIIMGKYPYDTVYYRNIRGEWIYKTIDDFVHE